MLEIITGFSIAGIIFGFGIAQAIGFVVSVFTDGYAIRICLSGVAVGFISLLIFAIAIFCLIQGIGV